MNKNTNELKKVVACVACNEVVAADRRGHPYPHKPYDGLRKRKHDYWCDGHNYPGDKP
jgi:hypothetical protein